MALASPKEDSQDGPSEDRQGARQERGSVDGGTGGHVSSRQTKE